MTDAENTRTQGVIVDRGELQNLMTVLIEWIDGKPPLPELAHVDRELVVTDLAELVKVSVEACDSELIAWLRMRLNQLTSDSVLSGPTLASLDSLDTILAEVQTDIDTFRARRIQ